MVFRSFEKLIGKNVIRFNILGIMGVFGLVFIVKEKYESGYKIFLLFKEELNNIKLEVSVIRCKGCLNYCFFIINKFFDNEIFILGNRCEKGEVIYGDKKIGLEKKKLINLFKYKYNRIFRYKLLEKEEVKNGEIGILRVLNMYEDYLFWFIFFNVMGFRVVFLDRLLK